MESPRAQWGSRAGFILAAAGSAIGLGNIWKFPYITGENGGGLFVIIYLVCIALVGIPIMMAEIMIGRAAQKQPVGAFETLQGKKTGWSMVGWMGVLAGFIILSYYIVVAGWAMDYTLKSVVNFSNPIHEKATVEAMEYRATTDLGTMRTMLSDRDATRSVKNEISGIRNQSKPSVWEGYARYQAVIQAKGDTPEIRERLLSNPELRDQVEEAEALLPDIAAARLKAQERAIAHFDSLPDEEILNLAEDVIRRAAIFQSVQGAFLSTAGDGWTCTFWALLFMLITILIVSGGISKGIERTCRVLMPTLFVLLLVMVGYGAFQPGFGQGLSFIFKPDVSKLEASGVLEALGHAFFTLSLGMGAMITYGSYQQSKSGLVGQSIIIAVLDTAIALLACLMIFPIIFTYDQEPAAGPGLVFMSMPLAFAEIGKGGMLLAIFFFGLLVFAALTSAISLLEVVASYFIDQLKWSRNRAAWLLGGAIFLFSIPSAFSLDPNFAMSGWEPSFGKNFFDTMDYLASNWMLPLGGLLISVYAGWIMPKRLRAAEVEGLAPAIFGGWLILVRFVAPILVVVVLMQKVGIIDANEIFHGLFH